VPKPGFTLEQLRSFVAVAEAEHISRAAASLFLTQAAVTQQLKHFEQAVGVQLLERDGRRVRLTDAGRTLAEACRAALRAVEVVGETANATKQLKSGSLHVGASPTCATYYLPPYLGEFARRHPTIRLEMTVEPSAELNRRVGSATLDCALIGGPADRGLLAFELARDELVLIAHRDHPLSQLRRLTRANLAQYRYLGRGPQLSAGRSVRDMLGDAYDHVETMNLGHTEYIRAAAVAGLGYAVLSRRAVGPDISSGLLKLLPVPPIVRPINAVRRPGRGGPAQEAFWDLLTGGDGAPSGKMPSRGRATP
jgi:DNA-binding transcriptional LysR family regulator